MTREQRLALIIGFCLTLIVAILIADHLSPGSNSKLADMTTASRFDQIAPSERDIPGGTHETIDSTLLTSNPAIRIFGGEDGTAGLQIGEIESPDDLLDPSGPRNELVMGETGRGPAAGPDSNRSDLQRDPATARESTYVVRENDTLYAIAQKHYGSGALWVELGEYNTDVLPDDLRIRPGTKLRIPDKSVLTDSAKNPPKSEADKPVATPTSPGPETKAAVTPLKTRNYVIAKGDTLDKISARLLGTSKRWREILTLNPGLDPKKLKVGATIKLPSK